MQVQEIMTRDPACCGPNSTIQDAARIMADKSVGSVPVLNDAGEPVGIVTDRDICCGAVAEGRTNETPVSEVMSTDLLTTTSDEDVSSCCDKMEERQVRRAVVTDNTGKCCGMIAQADIARDADGEETAELVQEISKSDRKSGCC
ncbi:MULTISPECIES: CBS domain-containing protein [unclassified Hoeflea]|uniref:CBS domain-containing protein n=1 Tax=unclassified Hoeflea TaxID=2614931 RepID=UPI000C0FD452|nr:MULTISPECIES: CBS domain-containing protein [unclassified Hoeflea]PHR20357.1 MAG: CBS domain-containing protein [Hoeflea sp.]VVT35490.1 CBS domain-containing protein [Hoeflea sp. EC-HK425]